MRKWMQRNNHPVSATYLEKKLVRTIGYKQIRTSDLTGNELKDQDVITVAVRTEGKIFDASAEELSTLKRLTNVIELEYRHPDGNVETVICTQAEFSKIITPEKLETFDSLRGRRSGFKPAS